MARAGRINLKTDVIILGVCVLLSLISLILPVQVREPMASAMRRGILAPLISLQERAELSRRALLLHEPTTASRDSVALRAMNASALEVENNQLRKLIGLGSRLKWGFVPAEALRTSAVRDASLLVLSAGSRSGIVRLSPVVSPAGLIGMVDDVDPTMSKALMWTHPEFRVSAMTPDASTFGIVQAHISGDGGGVGSDGDGGASITPGRSPGDYLMELRGVPFRAQLKPGQIIVSSGLGGVFPRGIPVGTVIQEIKGAESWARTYLVRPAVFPDDVNSVMVLLPARAAQGVDNIWEIGEDIQNAAARIVEAGDSLSREAALAEAAARRAALDSIRADSIARNPQPVVPVIPTVPTNPVPPRPRPVIPPSQVDTTRDTNRI